jgi:AcrR family transcriptional regulator
VDDKHRRILDAALRTFADRGYHGTVVPDVAEAAGVGTGTLYRYFANKEALVNEVYRDAKERLRAALLGTASDATTTATIRVAAEDLLSSIDLYRLDAGEQWFAEVWRRLGTFARQEPDAFRFLEMQDHVPYLDTKSKQVELSVLAPLWIAGKRLRGTAKGAPVDVLIALLWGAFVGLIKAGRLGYLRVDDKSLEQAGAACWRLIAPEPSHTSSRPRTTPASPPRATPGSPPRATPASPLRATPASPPRVTTPSPPRATPRTAPTTASRAASSRGRTHTPKG